MDDILNGEGVAVITCRKNEEEICG